MIVRARVKELKDFPEHLLCCDGVRQEAARVAGQEFTVDASSNSPGGHICSYCQKWMSFPELAIVPAFNGKYWAFAEAIELDEVGALPNERYVEGAA
jgi:hypothetical protein